MREGFLKLGAKIDFLFEMANLVGKNMNFVDISLFFTAPKEIKNPVGLTAGFSSY